MPPSSLRQAGSSNRTSRGLGDPYPSNRSRDSVAWPCGAVACLPRL